MEKAKINDALIKNKNKILLVLLIVLGLTVIAINWSDFTSGLNGEAPVGQHDR